MATLLHSEATLYSFQEKKPSNNRRYFVEQALRTAALAIRLSQTNSANIVHELLRKRVSRERNGDTSYPNIYTALLGKKVADVPKLRRRDYIATYV